MSEQTGERVATTNVTRTIAEAQTNGNQTLSTHICVHLRGSRAVTVDTSYDGWMRAAQRSSNTDSRALNLVYSWYPSEQKIGCIVAIVCSESGCRHSLSLHVILYLRVFESTFRKSSAHTIHIFINKLRKNVMKKIIITHSYSLLATVQSSHLTYTQSLSIRRIYFANLSVHIGHSTSRTADIFAQPIYVYLHAEQ